MVNAGARLDYIKKLLEDNNFDKITFDDYLNGIEPVIATPSMQLLNEIRNLRESYSDLFRRLDFQSYDSFTFIEQVNSLDKDDIKSIKEFIIKFNYLINKYKNFHFDDAYLLKIIKIDVTPIISAINGVFITDKLLQIVETSHRLWIDLH